MRGMSLLLATLITLAACGGEKPPPPPLSLREPEPKKKTTARAPEAPPPEAAPEPQGFKLTVVETKPTGGGAAGSSPEPAAERPRERIPYKVQVDHKALINKLVVQLDVAGILAETARLRKMEAPYAQIVAQMRDWEAKIQESLGEIAKLGDRYSVPNYIKPGDKLLSLGNDDLTKVKPGEAGRLLEAWLRQFKGNAIERCRLVRGTQPLELIFYCPDATNELQLLSKLVGIPLGEGGDALADEQIVRAVPEDLVKQIDGRFASLPKGYRQLMPSDDRARMEKLLAARKGFSPDIDFLRNRILNDLLARFAQEADRVRARLAEIEAPAMDSVTDTLVMKSGSRMDARILEDTGKAYKVRMGTGLMTIQKEQIEKVERGTGAGGEFPGRLKAAKGNVEALVNLMQWCKDRRLPVQKEYLAFLVMSLDPTNARARQESALPPLFPPSAADLKKAEEAKAALSEKAAQEATIKQVERIAVEVVKSTNDFGNVVKSIRSKTIALKFKSLDSLVPDKFAEVANYIGNPVVFDAHSLPAARKELFDTWWAKLDVPNRTEFARFFGLWHLTNRDP